MLFNSIQFLIFFPIVVILYFSIPHKYRWGLLLAASFYFYMSWNPGYIILLIVATVINYFSAIQIEKAKSKKHKKTFLLIGLLTSLSILFTYKYLNFFTSTFVTFIKNLNILITIPKFHLLLPVGISFYTFQTLSYTIDVYRGDKKAEKNLGIFALYVSFFPQLVAGPIERSTRLLPQFFEKHSFDYKRIANGLRLMMWGGFKKIVVADRLAVYVNTVYNNVGHHNGSTLLLATYFFAIQIYCDFSGYSDIAIGAAKIMGFDLMENFRRPYFSKSISEFWKRWHISLSSWFRDYLYIPLGGNRTSKSRWYLNLFIVFLVSGLWHGANWTFVIWGAIHGFYLIFSILTTKIRTYFYETIGLNRNKKIKNIFEVFITFHLVLFSWIFFRANTLGDALIIIKKITTTLGDKIFVGSSSIMLYSIMGIIILLSFDFLSRKEKVHNFFDNFNLIHRWSLYIFFILTTLMIGVFNASSFIYFQF